MKKLFTLLMSMALAMAFAVPVLAQEFQSGDLLYEIISDDPPEVSLTGHVDGQNAQGELAIPETVQFEGTDYTVAEIAWYAFFECSGLTGSLVLPNSLRVIHEFAFYRCNGLTGTLVLPESVTEVMLGAFTHCRGLTGTLAIPNSVSRLGDASYYPQNLDSLGTFQGCLGFDRLVLPESIEYIGYQCFAECANLQGELTLPEGLTEIDAQAFEGCSGLSGTIAFPQSLEFIHHWAFKGCSGIENIVLPDRFVLFNDLNQNSTDGAFEGCSGLTRVEIPEGWEKMGFYTFRNCANLSSVHLPESLRVIGMHCFENCTSLSEINLPEGLETIDNEAFNGCTSLSEINFPEGLETIGNEAFSGCAGLTRIDLPKQLTAIGSAFRGCISLAGDMVVPDLVQIVPLLLFEGCTGISRVFLGSSANYVFESAFEDTQLESIVIRATTPPSLNRNYPYGWHLPADIPITVPCGTLDDYLNAEGWSEFTNISEGNTFLLRVSAEDGHKGEVRVLKEPVCGDMTVEVEAVPVDGNGFMGWEVNGVMASTENPFRFELEEDTEIVAFFSGMAVGEAESAVSVFPNPANSQVTVTAEGIRQVELLNLLGQKVAALDGDGAASVTIGLSDLPKGVYLVTVRNKEGECATKKLIVE